MSDTSVLEPTKAPALTDDQIDAAITSFRHAFRDDDRLAAISDEEIRTRVQDFMGSGRTLKFAPAPPKALEAVNVDECAVSIGVVIIDMIVVVIGWAGFHPPQSVAQVAGRAIAVELAESLPGWLRLTNQFIQAANAAERAAALYRIGAAAWTAGMWRTFFNAAQQQMQWWDWVIGGVTACAQIGVLFLSGGAAFIAELTLNAGMMAATLDDATKIPYACTGR